MNSEFDIRELIETVPATTLGVGVDPATAKALEAIHTAGEKLQSSFDLWLVINEQIGKAETPSLEAELVELRNRFENRLLATEVERVGQAFQQSSDSGWSLWLTTLARAIILTRLGFARNFCERSFPFTESQSQTLAEIKTAVYRMYQSRWADGYAVLEYVAGQNSLPPDIRAGLFAMLGQIQLYLYELARPAKELFEMAEKLAPEESLVLSAFGEYWVRQGNTERAKEYFERGMKNSLGKASAFVGMGTSSESEQDFGAAETWYRKAIDMAGGDPLGYQRLIKLYARPDLFKAHHAELVPLTKKVIIISPEDEYQAYLDLGFAYSENDQVSEARDWCQKAITLDETRPLGYISAAQCAEKAKRNDEAEALHRKAIEVAPDCYDGYFSLTAFYAQQEKWQEAIKCCSPAPEQIRQLSGIKHNLLGNLNYANGEYKKAVEQFSLATAAVPDSAFFHRNLSGAHKELKQYSEAGRELEEAFKLDDDKKSFDREMSLLANAEGNDHYERAEYEKAIERYRIAVTFDSGSDVIQWNLGEAWESSKEPGKIQEALENALAAFTAAQEIKATEKYERAIKRLQLKIEMAASYGERVLNLVPVVKPIVVEVALDLVPFLEDPSGALASELAGNLTSLRKRINDKLGVKLPGVQFKDNLGLSEGGYTILLAELPLVSGSVLRDQFFCTTSAEALSTRGIVGTEAINPVTGGKGFWITIEDQAKTNISGLELWTCMEFIIRHLEIVAERNLAEFLGHQEVADILAAESRKAPEANRIGPEKLSALTAVCRALVQERVPIKPFGEICEVFDGLYSGGTNLQNIVENVRTLPALGPALWGNDPQYSLLPLGPRLETDLRRSIYQPDAHPVLAMEPYRCQNILTLLRSSIGERREVAVVVEDPELRPFIRLFELEFPNLAVLSRRELRTDLEFHTLAQAELDGEVPSAQPDFKSSNRIDPAGRVLAIDGQAETAGPEEVGIIVFANQSLINERSKADDHSIEEMFSMLQDGLFFELGIVLPQIHLTIDESLKTNQFRFKLNNREYQPLVGLESDEFLVNDVVNRLKLLNIEGKEAINPANGSKCAIVREEKDSSAICRQAGLTTWGPVGFLVLALSAEIRKNAAQFQTQQVTGYLLSILQTLSPELVTAVANRFPAEQIRLILRDLLDEEISIRDLRRILESLLSINGTTDVDLRRYIVFAPPAEGLCPVTDDVDDLTIADYSSYVRMSLKKYISHKYTKGAEALIVYLLDPELEKRLSNLGAQPLTMEENIRLMAAVKSVLQNLPATAQNAVILTAMDVRKTVRKLIENDFPNLAVLSYQELVPDISIQPIALIALAKFGEIQFIEPVIEPGERLLS